MTHLFLNLLIFLAIPEILAAVGMQPYHTTAFIAPAYSLDILFSASTYEADRFWNEDGKELRTFNHFRSQSYFLYAEYAANDQNSVWINGGYTIGKAEMDGQKLGIEDSEAGWKHLLHEGERSALTLQMVGIIPSGSTKTLIRYGEWGAELGVLFSDLFCFLKREGWYDLGIAYRYYHGFPSDQVRTFLSCGYDLAKALSVIGSLLLDYGVYNGKRGFHANHILLNPKYRLLRARGELRWSPFSYFTVTLGGFSHIWGQDISKGSGFLGGVWIDI